MMARKSPLYHLRWILPVAAILVLSGVVITWMARMSYGSLPYLGRAPQFSLTAQTGASFTDKAIAGQLTVLSFGFTRCKTICPVTQKHMADIYHTFKGSQDLRLVSITSDPEHDTPAVLAEYLKNWGVDDDRWVYLSGTKNEFYHLSVDGFRLPAGLETPDHSSRFVLIDRKGMIRGYYDGMDEESIRQLMDHIRKLARE